MTLIEFASKAADFALSLSGVMMLWAGVCIVFILWQGFRKENKPKEDKPMDLEIEE
jgi:hypothetical protein